jgi:hypothetical protein
MISGIVFADFSFEKSFEKTFQKKIWQKGKEVLTFASRKTETGVTKSSDSVVRKH